MNSTHTSPRARRSQKSLLVRAHTQKFLITKESSPITSSQPYSLYEATKNTRESVWGARGFDFGKCIDEIQKCNQLLKLKSDMLKTQSSPFSITDANDHRNAMINLRKAGPEAISITSIGRLSPSHSRNGLSPQARRESITSISSQVAVISQEFRLNCMKQTQSQAGLLNHDTSANTSFELNTQTTPRTSLQQTHTQPTQSTQYGNEFDINVHNSRPLFIRGTSSTKESKKSVSKTDHSRLNACFTTQASPQQKKPSVVQKETPNRPKTAAPKEASVFKIRSYKPNSVSSILCLDNEVLSRSVHHRSMNDLPRKSILMDSHTKTASASRLRTENKKASLTQLLSIYQS